jgi:outer membrane receptor protein involved in Fe transport
MSRTLMLASRVLAAMLLAGLPRVSAQTAASNAPEDESTIVLSPFLVEATEDADSYRATATLAGTRIRTELRDVGSAISVVTSKFLQDTNSRNAQDLLVYTTGTEVAGQGGNFLGQGDGAVLTATNRSAPITNTRVRGLAEADNTRDFYLSDIPWDSYNVGRVDLQRGPNAILFGIGSPAGIVNSSLNSASFQDSNKVEAQYGRFESYRFSADFNKVILSNELAARLSLLREDTKYRQDPAFKEDERIYGALRYEPGFLARGNARTSLRMHYEKGHIDRNDPRSTPPLDAITPWFGLNKVTLDQRTANDTVAGNPWFGAPGGRVFDGTVTAFDGGSQGISYPAQVNAWPNFTGNIDGSGAGNNSLRGIRTFNEFANAAFPEGAIGAYKAKSLTDRSIFDFYNHLLEGPNKNEFNDFDALNIALSQTFLNNKLGFELAYDEQDAKWGYNNFLSGDASVITVDLMHTLADGSPNPHAGRPMTISGGGSAGLFRQHRIRESKRATGFGELNFPDLIGRDNRLSYILGRHVFTGLYSEQENNSNIRRGPRYFLSNDYGVNNDASVGQAARDNIFYNYLGSSLAGLSSASGLGLVGLKSHVQPQLSTINVWNNVANAWQRVPLITHNNDLLSDEAKLYTQAEKTRSVVDSSAFVWQAYLFGGDLVPMVGWRKDTETFRSAGSPTNNGGIADVNNPNWRLPTSKTDLNDGQRKWNKVSGNSNTWSVVAHLPRRWRERLPGQLGLSLFYNESENFQPDAGRRDIFGTPVASPAGETKDYGFSISALDDRITLKINRYETTVTNANVASEIGGQYLIGAVEGWGQQAAIKFRDFPGQWPASTIYGYTRSGQPVTWRPAGPLQGSDETGYTYSPDELDATYARQQASINAWFATQVPANFREMWGLTDYATGGGTINFAPSGLTVTGDTVSKGTEFELIATPIKGLDIAVNASKTSAKRINLAQSYTEWIQKRWQEFQGPAGDMRLWGGEDDSSADSTHGGETARGKFRRETMAGYRLFQALQDSDVPELRPWRFSVVANYTFQSESMLRGVNAGGSYRWQDRAIVGFPVIQDSAGNYIFDVDNPYKGSTEGVFDTWIGYQRKLTDRINWRVQLNVRNLFANDELIRVTVQPDGSPGAYRIPEPRTWSVTSTFTF